MAFNRYKGVKAIKWIIGFINLLNLVTTSADAPTPEKVYPDFGM
jgi:hypothetical protein